MIYVIRHKPCITPTLKGYETFHVGNNETLSALNPYINEATGLYEIWKKPDRIKGLVHYRRFFVQDGDYLSIDITSDILKKYDVITTVDFEPSTPLEHLTSNLDKAVVEKYVYQLPYDVIRWFESHNAFNICNMFVSKREFIDAYCEWMFPLVLPMVEQFISEDLTGDFKKNRTIGFIIECLFGYYCKDFQKYRMEVRII